MANYYSCSRTNYFRVTDEEKYKRLFANLVGGEDDVHDFSKEKDGVTYHAFGAYGSIDYAVPFGDEGDYDYDFDIFLKELQAILPEKEAFIYMESGHEKLRYITGLSIIVTKDKIESVNICTDALNRAKEMLGDAEFSSDLCY